MFVDERFQLNNLTKRTLQERTPRFGFGRLGEIIYARTYSRVKANGEQENWADTVTRVVEGVGSIRKDWHLKHRLPWDEQKWQGHLHRMALAIFDMRFLSGGRGLWAGGTEYVYERGGMALNNCAYTRVDMLSHDLAWGMDVLMCGVGLGLGDVSPYIQFRSPAKSWAEVYVIPDTREGWVDSIRRLVESYERGSAEVFFDYSLIRGAGAPIRGFGGTASGPDPLRKLHERLREYLDNHIRGKSSLTRLVADCFNAVGACVVAGNVRRSAELYLGEVGNTEFLQLKNYDLYPDRADIGWMSNNTVVLSEIDHFTQLPDIGEMVRNNGEPGVMNLLNVQKYGRYGDELKDDATGTNPCAEISLENKELCCLVEVFPTRCQTDVEYYEALELAHIYAHTISLLPTHSEETNAVVARNHRIGQSLSGIADWFDKEGASPIITKMREGYKIVRASNKRLAQASGVPESIRVTTVKPSGTISQLAGVSSGMHYPVYRRFIRRVRFGKDTTLVPLLIEAGIPYEDDIYSDNTYVFSFPVETEARRAQRDISMWQKGAMVLLLQKHWADNMVSNTITFDPKTEGHQVEDFLAHYVPFIKTLSLLPDRDEGAYEQMPYEQITAQQYKDMSRDIKEIDWRKFGNSDGIDSKFCNNDQCDL